MRAKKKNTSPSELTEDANQGNTRVVRERGMCSFFRQFGEERVYSNSMVDGGFGVMSYNTRFTPGTSATTLTATFLSSS